MRVEHRAYCRGVFQVAAHKLEPFPIREPRQAGFLQGHVVVAVQVVEAHNLIATVEQAVSGEGSNEAGSAGNQYFHKDSLLLPRSLKTRHIFVGGQDALHVKNDPGIPRQLTQTG